MVLTIKKLNDSARAEVFFRPNNAIITNLWGDWRTITDPALKDFLLNIKKTRSFSEVSTAPEWENVQRMNPDDVSMICSLGGMASGSRDYSSVRRETETTPAFDGNLLVKKLFDFFSEFQFRPQARFVNSIANLEAKAATDYVIGYFSLTNHPCAKDVVEKTKSMEWKELAKEIAGKATQKINKRFTVYYGEPGSGKTTTAIKENPDAEVVVCHANMTPDELFRGFDFEDGKPVFNGCPLRRAMEEGKTVILDEINLLNEDCRRTLQAITDNKSEVMINSDKVYIKDGFRIVGTMNLQVGGMTYGLPEPLVDRAEVIKEFSMTPAMVASMAF